MFSHSVLAIVKLIQALSFSASLSFRSETATLFRFQRNAGTNRVWTRAVAMALLNVFCKTWVLGRLVLRPLVAGLEALMVSALELIFIQYY